VNKDAYRVTSHIKGVNMTTCTFYHRLLYSTCTPITSSEYDTHTHTPIHAQEEVCLDQVSDEGETGLRRRRYPLPNQIFPSTDRLSFHRPETGERRVRPATQETEGAEEG